MLQQLQTCSALSDAANQSSKTVGFGIKWRWGSGERWFMFRWQVMHFVCNANTEQIDTAGDGIATAGPVSAQVSQYVIGFSCEGGVPERCD